MILCQKTQTERERRDEALTFFLLKLCLQEYGFFDQIIHMYNSYLEIPNSIAILLDSRVGHFPPIEDPQGTAKAILKFHQL